MKKQWDDIAKDNAFFGVLSTDKMEEIDSIDVNYFWESGKKDVDMIMNDLDLGNKKDLKMLEIGCGLGRMSHYFSELFENVIAVDVSSEMLDRAKSYWGRLDNVEWVLGNGENIIHIENESLDFVFSFQVFQHIPNEQITLQYIREASRVLKKGKTAFLHFRTFPEGYDLLAIRYRITAKLPDSVVKLLRKVWDLSSNDTRTLVKYNSEYESWRGCAIEKSMIESVAKDCNLNIIKKGSYATGVPSRWSTFFVFQKQ